MLSRRLVLGKTLSIEGRTRVSVLAGLVITELYQVRFMFPGLGKLFGNHRSHLVFPFLCGLLLWVRS